MPSHLPACVPLPVDIAFECSYQRIVKSLTGNDSALALGMKRGPWPRRAGVVGLLQPEKRFCLCCSEMQWKHKMHLPTHHPPTLPPSLPPSLPSCRRPCSPLTTLAHPPLAQGPTAPGPGPACAHSSRQTASCSLFLPPPCSCAFNACCFFWFSRDYSRDYPSSHVTTRSGPIDVPATLTLHDANLPVCYQEALDWRKRKKGGCSFVLFKLSAQFNRAVMVPGIAQ